MFSEIQLCVIGKTDAPYLQRSNLGGSEINIQYLIDRDTFLLHLKESQPDLILCPRISEELTAQEVLDVLRQYHRTIPVIVIGEIGDDERHIVPLIKAGAADYVSKSNMDRLWEVIETALAASGKWTQKSYLAQINKASTPLVVFMIDTEGMFTMVRGSNVSMQARMLHRTPAAEFFGNTLEVKKFFSHASAGETVSIRVEAHGRIWDVHCSPLKDGTGKLVGASGTAIDVTRSRLAARQLARNEKRWQAIFDENVDVLLIADEASGSIRETNRALKRVLGYEPHDIIGKKISVLLPNDKLESYDEDPGAVYRVLLNQPFLKADGSLLLMDMSITKIDWVDEKVVLLTLRDVSEQRAAEKALSEKQNILQTVIDHAPLIIFTMDVNGIVTAAQGRLSELFNTTPPFVIGKPVFDLIQRYPQIVEDYKKVVNGELLHGIHHFDHIILEGFYRPIRDAQGNLTTILAVTIDITEREKAQKLLLDAERIRLEIANEREVITLREGFISMITHEFRQPITTILSSSDMLTLYEERMDSSARTRHLSKISGQAKFMQELLEDMLMVSSARSGRLNLQLEIFNLFDLCVEVVEQLGLGAENAEHHFVMALNGHSTDVYLDYRLTHHILSNLLTNAVKYTPQGGTILLEVQIKNDRVHLRIEDTGIGIPDADQRRLFEPFFRARNRGKVRGTGLGLALVRYSIEAMNGTIDLQSVEGKGTAFTIVLPKVINNVTS